MLQIKDHPLYGKHDIDSAMNSFWGFYKSRFITLFLTSFVMAIVVQYCSSHYLNLTELQSVADPSLLIEKIREYIIPIIVISLIGLVFNNILHYYILFNPLDGSKNILISSVYSLIYFIPYLLILVILAFFGSIAIALGLMVLIVGVIFSFIYLMMLSMFIMPVMMTEGINIGNTIARTIKLSHKNFWNNMGWTSVFLIMILIFSAILSGLVMLPFTGSFFKSFSSPEAASKIMEITKSPLYIVLVSLINALTMPAIPIFAFLLYFNGRAREVVVQSPVYGDQDYKVKVEDLYAKPLPWNDDEGRKDEEAGK